MTNELQTLASLTLNDQNISKEEETISLKQTHSNGVNHAIKTAEKQENLESCGSIQPFNDIKNRKRTDYLNWKDYFMNLALLSAQRSKDPSTQVGACLVDPQNKIVGIGYNGMPSNIDDDMLPWGKESIDPMQNKYLYVCHAELNAILNKNAADLKGCSLYVTLFPCNECAKVIIQSGISKIFYFRQKNKESPSVRASSIMLSMAGIEVTEYKPKSVYLNWKNE